jgi:hypothetical protein
LAGWDESGSNITHPSVSSARPIRQGGRPQPVIRGHQEHGEDDVGEEPERTTAGVGDDSVSPVHLKQYWGLHYVPTKNPIIKISFQGWLLCHPCPPPPPTVRFVCTTFCKPLYVWLKVATLLSRKSCCARAISKCLAFSLPPLGCPVQSEQEIQICRFWVAVITMEFMLTAEESPRASLPQGLLPRPVIFTWTTLQGQEVNPLFWTPRSQKVSSQPLSRSRPLPQDSGSGLERSLLQEGVFSKSEIFHCTSLGRGESPMAIKGL